MLSWALGNRKVELWEPHKGKIPSALCTALQNPEITIAAWSANFEWNGIKRFIGLDIPIERFLDIMVWARHLSLPGSLEDCGEALGLAQDEAKIKDGKRLIQKFSAPFRMGGRETWFGIEPPQFHDWEDEPEDWQKFCEYCIRDTETERKLHQMMEKLPLPEIEQRSWALDQKINQRGIPTHRSSE